MEITTALVTPIAEAKILELAYKVSGVINLERVTDNIYQAGVLVRLLDVLNDDSSLLVYAEKQQLMQGLIGIGKLKI